MIYLDYQSTTPTDPRVVTAMLPFFTKAFGNPSSVDHSFGDDSEGAIAQATHQVTQLVMAPSAQVIFTSGATEAANLAIAGFVRRRHEDGIRQPVRIGVSPVEHSAVLETCRVLERRGEASVTLFSVDDAAQLELADVRAKARRGLDLICVMAANNEVGTIYPIKELTAIAHESGAAVFTDATQAAGKIPVDMTDSNADMLALSAHKMYGPKGIGALVVSPGVKLSPLLYGGSQQNNLRPGTLNVPAIVGFGEACLMSAREMEADAERIGKLRNHMQHLLQERVPDITVNGDVRHRLSGNLHVSFLNTPNQAIVARVRDCLAISTGSACASGIEGPSHVLQAMQLSEPRLTGAIRISLGKYTTAGDIVAAIDHLENAVNNVRSIMGTRAR